MKIIGFPHLYKQGAGLIKDIGEHLASLGEYPLLVIDEFIDRSTGGVIEESLNKEGMRFQKHLFSGEPTPELIEELTATSEKERCDIAVGIGGGKAIDTAKSIKVNLGVPVVIVPTIASNDAPTSRLAVTYTSDGMYYRTLLMKTNPELLLVDSEIIARAPPRFLSAGMGDALATCFEAEQCRRSGTLNYFGGKSTEAAIILAGACHDLIRRNGKEAIESVKKQRVTPALDRVIEANVLMSGLGFEGCGVAAAHVLSAGFPLIETLHGNLHGEEVAWSLLVQFVMEERSDEFIGEMARFYREIDLPTSLADFGLIDLDEKTLKILSHEACYEGSNIYSMDMTVTEEVVIKAIQRAEEMSRSW